ncbi:MAG: UDP-N-acetylmuramoyl-tripeptide--D-alanyl-D-alanine ligase [Eubacterium sp.]|nr:UDP-N-acetylmuramoyl-tripeptide--D-alanyl-D-alanine ligase [Eubacterium sp.]
MNGLSVKEIIDITNGSLLKICEKNKEDILNIKIDNIALDSRKTDRGSLFVALPGEKTDGHKFIPSVAAGAVLVQKDEKEILAVSGAESLSDTTAYIRVDNTSDALKKIGAFARGLYKNKIVGVTGSVGKTTTREMIAHALSASVKTFQTKGNMNSQLGVPVTLFNMSMEPSDVAVLEMGISVPGEMDNLTAMVRPDIAAVTMIGVAHIEFMKDQVGIRTEKLKIIDRMDENGVVFLNADDPLLFEMKDKLKVKTLFYGTNPEADYIAENIRTEDGFSVYEFVHGDKKHTVKLSALGKHNVLNSLVAMAICDYLGYDLDVTARSFESFKGLRQRVINSDKGYTIIDDTYNASPDSMKAALNVLSDMNCKRKIAVLGDMFELGQDSDRYHKEVGEYIFEKTEKNGSFIDELITIGESSKLIAEGTGNAAKTISFASKEEAVKYISDVLTSGDSILFKASNGMKLSTIVEEIL